MVSIHPPPAAVETVVRQTVFKFSFQNDNVRPYMKDDGTTAQWLCHRAMCEWTGGSSLEGRRGNGGGSGLGGAKGGKKGDGKNSRPGSGSSVGMGVRRGSGAGGAVKLPPPEALERIGPGQLTPAAATWAAWLQARGISLEVAERNGTALPGPLPAMSSNAF